MGGDKKKTRKNRRAYLDDFQKTVSGEYIYTGDVFRWEKDRKKSLLLMWLASAAALASAIIVGCIPNAGMEGHVFILLPYIATIWGGGSQLWAVAKLNGAGEEVRAYVLEKSAEKLPARALVTAIASGIAIFGELVVIFYPGMSCSLDRAVIFLVLQAVQVFEGIWMFRFVRCLQWTK